METKCESSLNTGDKSNILIPFNLTSCYCKLIWKNESWGKMSEILEMPGNFMRGKNWEHCITNPHARKVIKNV